MLKPLKSEILIITFLLAVVLACRENPVPKPRGYFRIDFPEKNYIIYDTACPFTFEYPGYGKVSYETGDYKEPCWFNIIYPMFRATLHISYRQLNGNLYEILKEADNYVYSHSVKADAITEQPWNNPDKKVYGLLYDLKGNTASAIQFLVTDSTKHFVRGALYFSAVPNEDSLAPVISFFREDIVHLIESFRWK